MKASHQIQQKYLCFPACPPLMDWEKINTFDGFLTSFLKTLFPCLRKTFWSPNVAMWIPEVELDFIVVSVNKAPRVAFPLTMKLLELEMRS